MAQPNPTSLRPGQIETGVPMPGPAGRVPSSGLDAIRRLASANVGDSVFIPEAWYRQDTIVNNWANRIGGTGWMTSRKEPGGRRCWKVAEPKYRA